MEFTTALVRALAWPATVVTITVLLRPAIQSSLEAGQLKRLKLGLSGAEFEWDRAATGAREHLPADAAEKAEEAPGGGLVGELTELAEVHPPSAVLEAFIRIEHELRRVVEIADPSQRWARMGARQLADVAHRAGIISENTRSAVDGLSVMRNLAAHGQAGDLNTERALEFVEIADAVLYAVGESARATLPAEPTPTPQPTRQVRQRRPRPPRADAVEGSTDGD